MSVIQLIATSLLFGVIVYSTLLLVMNSVYHFWMNLYDSDQSVYTKISNAMGEYVYEDEDGKFRLINDDSYEDFAAQVLAFRLYRDRPQMSKRRAFIITVIVTVIPLLVFLSTVLLVAPSIIPRG